MRLSIFADKERFGELLSWELEYRAKLTELALARTTLAGLLQAFSNNQGDDPAIPHSYANKRVLSAIRAEARLGENARLADAPPEAIHAAALAVLRTDSARRRPRSPPAR